MKIHIALRTASATLLLAASLISTPHVSYDNLSVSRQVVSHFEGLMEPVDQSGHRQAFLCSTRLHNWFPWCIMNK